MTPRAVEYQDDNGNWCYALVVGEEEDGTLHLSYKVHGEGSWEAATAKADSDRVRCVKRPFTGACQNQATRRSNLIMTPSTEKWINDRLVSSGLGPVERNDEFWEQMWAHAIGAADERQPLIQQHTSARYAMVRAIETLYYGRPLTEVPVTVSDWWPQ